jgi:hypothetical protein
MSDFSYQIYGLRVDATRPIPGLTPVPSTGDVDLRVHFQTIGSPLASEPDVDEQLHYTSAATDGDSEPAWTMWTLARGSCFRIRYHDGTEFLVDMPGSRIWATWRAPLTLDDTAVYLLGPILGLVLRLRGAVCLHASAVVVEGRAIALMGPAGAGKSTTAAAFAKRGCSILSDDIVTLSPDRGHFLVQPGYPHLKLWPDAAGALFGSPDSLPCLTPNWDKRYLSLANGKDLFRSQPVRLAAIYLIGESRAEPGAPYVEAVSVRDGMLAVIANSRAAYSLDRSLRATEYGLLGHIIQTVPVRRVTPLPDLAQLSATCDVICEDLLSLAASVRHVGGQRGRSPDAVTG